MKEILKTLIVRFQEKGLPADLVTRKKKLEPYFKTNNAIVITGPRRAGKTYLMFQCMQELDLPMEQIVYINFEDNVLVDFTHHNFEDILDAYKELYHGKKPVFFLDEIHTVPKWELFVRKLVDNRFKVFVTGSNSQLLSKEYATLLGGRFLEIEIFPLDFKEFLRFKNVNYNQKILYSDHRFKILALFDEYLNFGGFPEVTLSNDANLKEKLIDAYFKTAFFRDIVDRYNIRDETLFEIILKKAAENIGQPFSFRSVKNKLQPFGYSVSLKTIIKYFEYAANGYLLIPSLLKRESLIKRKGMRKVYFIDNGYLNTFFVSENFSRKFENAIAINLFFHKKPLHYFRNSFEIDFVLDSFPPIQASYTLSDENTLKREIKGLVKYCARTNHKSAYLLTRNDTQTITQNGITVNILPAWYFLLFEI